MSELADETLTAVERAALLNGRKVPGETERQRIARVAAEIVAVRTAALRAKVEAAETEREQFDGERLEAVARARSAEVALVALRQDVALALEALAWDRPYDTRIAAARDALLAPQVQEAVCAGCNVREPFEHRCHGEPCGCEECAEERRIFDVAPQVQDKPEVSEEVLYEVQRPRTGGYGDAWYSLTSHRTHADAVAWAARVLTPLGVPSRVYEVRTTTTRALLSAPQDMPAAGCSEHPPACGCAMTESSFRACERHGETAVCPLCHEPWVDHAAAQNKPEAGEPS